MAAALKEGESFDPPSRGRESSLAGASTGGLGNLGLPDSKKRIRQARSWSTRERKRFDQALRKLAAGRRRRPLTRRMTADRRKRHLKILELISTRPVRTQEELADALTAQGWEVTQSSVSRDIAALRLVKVDGAYRRPPGACARGSRRARIAEGVLTIEPAGDALVVLHTPPGEANHVAVALDRLAWPEVIGTIAGDDTIFLAVRDSRAQRRVLREVRKLISQ